MTDPKKILIVVGICLFAALGVMGYFVNRLFNFWISLLVESS